MRSQRLTRSQADLTFDSLDGRILLSRFALVHFDHIVQGSANISYLNHQGRTHTGNGSSAENHIELYTNRDGNRGASQFHFVRTIGTFWHSTATKPTAASIVTPTPAGPSPLAPLQPPITNPVAPTVVTPTPAGPSPLAPLQPPITNPVAPTIVTPTPAGPSPLAPLQPPITNPVAPTVVTPTPAGPSPLAPLQPPITNPVAPTIVTPTPAGPSPLAPLQPPITNPVAPTIVTPTPAGPSPLAPLQPPITNPVAPTIVTPTPAGAEPAGPAAAADHGRGGDFGFFRKEGKWLPKCLERFSPRTGTLSSEVREPYFFGSSSVFLDSTTRFCSADEASDLSISGGFSF